MSSSAASCALFTALVANLLLLLLSFHPSHGQKLEVGFYSHTCQDADDILFNVLQQEAMSDPTILPALVRLHFHDCIVDGCDGSILINKSDGTAEKGAFGHQGLRGFEVVDRAKEELEAKCPGVVSCSDIVAVLAHHAVVLSNGPNYEVETGRKDGLVSNIDHGSELPDANDSVETLIQKFSQKGLSPKEMVTLSGAHTIGTAACFFITDRLYGSGRPDSNINAQSLTNLKTTCPNGGLNTVRFPLDQGSERTFDRHIFFNMKQGLGVIRSDAGMYENPSTKAVIDGYLDDVFGSTFESDFGNAIIKLGSLGVITGSQGEIRKKCSAFN